MGINPNDNCQMPHWATTLSPLPQQLPQEDTAFSLFSLSSQQEQPQRSGPKENLGAIPDEQHRKSAEPETATHGDA